jgi:hypothetical protein
LEEGRSDLARTLLLVLRVLRVLVVLVMLVVVLERCLPLI